MTDQITIENFLLLSPKWLKPLESIGFNRRRDLEKISPTMATLVYLGEYVAFVFSLDIRDQCIDAEVVMVKNKKMIPHWDGGYSSNIFTHLIKHERYRGGPKGVNWSSVYNVSMDGLEQSVKGWLNLLETAGDKLLQDNINSLHLGDGGGC